MTIVANDYMHNENNLYLLIFILLCVSGEQWSSTQSVALQCHCCGIPQHYEVGESFVHGAPTNNLCNESLGKLSWHSQILLFRNGKFSGAGASVDAGTPKHW